MLDFNINDIDAKKEFKRIIEEIKKSGVEMKKEEVDEWVNLWYKRYSRLNDGKKGLFWILLDEKYKGYEVWRTLLELGVT
ncbi:hypothetical protein [Caminicella sporogenes]|uniref:hypothetical protein n=1 Tax=Caminicella sporogenes TaxID=166485 RepID=UPI00254257FD|nr:hypothetical protein [Caminicella sporogenes]WIF94294.1 hypothetical protein QNI18_08355 [Caminicella sporogenes]